MGEEEVVEKQDASMDDAVAAHELKLVEFAIHHIYPPIWPIPYPMTSTEWANCQRHEPALS